MPNAAMPLAWGHCPTSQRYEFLRHPENWQPWEHQEAAAPGETTATDENESPPRGVLGTGYQLQRVNAGGKNMGSVSDIQVVGLTLRVPRTIG